MLFIVFHVANVVDIIVLRNYECIFAIINITHLRIIV